MFDKKSRPFFFLASSHFFTTKKYLKFENARHSVGISALCDASRQIPSYFKITGGGRLSLK
jgi:hypothetical protein